MSLNSIDETPDETEGFYIFKNKKLQNDTF